jgi:hypothetical protein
MSGKKAKLIRKKARQLAKDFGVENVKRVAKRIKKKLKNKSTISSKKKI